MTTLSPCPIIFLYGGRRVSDVHRVNFIALMVYAAGLFIASKSGWNMNKMKNTFQKMPVESQVSGWFTSLFGMLTLSEWAILIGIAVTVCGYIRETRYKNRMIELEEIRVGLRDKQGNLIK